MVKIKPIFTEVDLNILEERLKNVFATKDDLNNLRKEIASEVTKAVVPEVTKAVVPQIVKTVIPQIRAVVSLVITKELTEQEEKYEKAVEKYKSEILDRVDPVLKEVVTKREERTIRAEQTRRHENRIEVLEKIHPQGKHPATI